MVSDEYQDRVVIGQAINIAVQYVLTVKDTKNMNYTQFEAEVREIVIPIQGMIKSIQAGYANAVKAIPEETVVFRQEPVKQTQLQARVPVPQVNIPQPKFR